MMDIGIYALNACRYLSGEDPVEVTAMTYSTPDDVRFKEVEETMLFTLRFPSGLLADCTSTYGWGVNRYRVTGTKGIVQSEAPSASPSLPAATTKSTDGWRRTTSESASGT